MTMNEKSTFYTRYEQHILDSRSLDQHAKHQFCEVLRTARLSHPQSDGHYQVIWNTATTVIAPAFFFHMVGHSTGSREGNQAALFFIPRWGDFLPHCSAH